MKVVLAGGTGQLGNILCRHFRQRNDEVVVVSRSPAAGQTSACRQVQWDGAHPGEWAAEIDGADVVINLAGRSVNCRYNEANKKLIMDSRLLSTRAVGQAIAGAKKPPRVWLQSSTATIYVHSLDRANDEYTGVISLPDPNAPERWNFSIEVATSWERAVDECETPATRQVKMRTTIVMSPDVGSPFDIILRLVRCGLGGKNGDGRQYVSWIHDEDFARAIDKLIDDESLSGCVNIAAPNPVPNDEFMRVLRESWGAPIGLPAPAWMLGMGARILGTETELILKSRRVVPARLLESGFEFRFPTWAQAARDLCRRSRDAASAPGA